VIWNVVNKCEAISIKTLGILYHCERHLKSCYLNRPVEPTRWSKLGGPAIYFDISIIKSRFLEERFREDHAMGLVKDKIKYVTINDILFAGHQKIILIEGDPGAGKTMITINICKRWAEGKLLNDELVFLVPLRDKYYQKVTNLNELFLRHDGCPEMKEYAQQNNGKGLIFILDGWDELPDQLQLQSFYHDIIFRKNALTCSTIIVTSRPSCSDHIAEAVQDHYYQILGFTPQTVETYVKEYFKYDLSCVIPLLEILNFREYLRRHFYIPITVVIICFVYHKNGNRLPETLSKLYEKFVLLCVRSNICENLTKNFKSLHSIPEELSPLFSKLCKIALRILINNTLVFDGEELEDELKQLYFRSTDVFGLLSVERVTNDLAEKEIHCSFIHRAVQELLAAMSILESNSIAETIDKYFHEDSYLINVFPFVFGLMSNVDLKHLTKILKQKVFESASLFSVILLCLFEAQDEMLCFEFGQVFNEENNINLKKLKSDLEYRHAAYFLSVCGCKQLNITIQFIGDDQVEIMSQYLCKSSTEIVSFSCGNVRLSEKGFKDMAKILSCQHNLRSLNIGRFVTCSPTATCFEIMSKSFCRCNLSIVKLRLLNVTFMNKVDLDSLGHLINTLKSLECLSIKNLGVPLKPSDSFSDAVCAKSLRQFEVCICSYDDGKMVSKILSQNGSLRVLRVYEVKDTDYLTMIFDALSTNKSVTMFTAFTSCIGAYSVTLGQSIEKCIASNQLLTRIILTGFTSTWSSSQVCSICAGLQSNNTLISLDISGCYIDKTAGNAMCNMLSLNTSLLHLFLNPVHMEKPEAVAIIGTCNINTTLQVLSLAEWSVKTDEINVVMLGTFNRKFAYSSDKEIDHIFNQLQISRQDKKKPTLKVIWLVYILRMSLHYSMCI